MSCRLNRIAAVLLAVAAVCSCQSLRTRPSTTPTKVSDGQPGIGLIEHRGRFYRMEDLMDPAYRAASSDRFVKNFGDTHLVQEWAGTSPEELLKLKRRSYSAVRELSELRSPVRPGVWAGMSPEDHSDRVTDLPRD